MQNGGGQFHIDSQNQQRIQKNKFEKYKYPPIYDQIQLNSQNMVKNLVKFHNTKPTNKLYYELRKQEISLNLDVVHNFKNSNKIMNHKALN